MGCAQSNIPKQTFINKKLKPLESMKGSEGSTFFIDNKHRLWKKRVETTAISSSCVEIRNLRIMMLPRSDYLLPPMKITRTGPRSTYTCMVLAGKDLFDYMNTPFDWKLMQIHLKHIRSAIHFLHNHNIAHRDIKPENVVFHRGTPKLIDFDYSTHLEVFRYCGTENYIVDELVVSNWRCSEATKSKRMDVYAFGKLVFSIFLSATQFKFIRHKSFVLHAFFNERFLPNPYKDEWGLWANVALECCRNKPPEQIPFMYI